MLNYYTMRSKILGALSWPLQVMIGIFIYKKIVRTIEGQGILKFSKEEIASLHQEIWDTLNSHMIAISRPGDRETPFWILGGDAPTEADATVFAFIASNLVCDASVAQNSLISSTVTNFFPVRQKQEPNSRPTKPSLTMPYEFTKSIFQTTSCGTKRT